MLEEKHNILPARERYVVLTIAFLGWFFAGMVMSTSTLTMRSAAIDLLSRTGSLDLAQYQAFNRAIQKHQQGPGAAPPLSSAEKAAHSLQEGLIKGWYANYQCAWLLGAATGGFALGRLGDRVGRAKGMACSILCYSVLAAMATKSQTPGQLLVIWFFACWGVGGMWPNGIALVSETWPNLSRPLVAGIIGMAANVGLFAMSTLGTQIRITPADWHWPLLVCAGPVVLGILALLIVPESPRWKSASRGAVGDVLFTEREPSIFRPPLFSITLVGIASPPCP